MEQRAATTPLQRTRFWLVLFSSVHVVPAAFISASVLLRQACFGRPTLRFPCGFQSRACLVMLDAGFHNVWPIQSHMRFLISVSIGVCFVLSHSCSFETTSGHLTLRMFLRLCDTEAELRQVIERTEAGGTTTTRIPLWPGDMVSASRAAGPGSIPVVAGSSPTSELKHWYSSGYPVRRLAF